MELKPDPYEKNYMRHRDFTTTPVHIIDRLHGSIPKELLAQKRKLLRQEILNIRKKVADLPKDKRVVKRSQLLATTRAKFEVELDDLLHNSSNGPYFLKDPVVAQIVTGTGVPSPAVSSRPC